MADDHPYRVEPGGLRLYMRLTPRANRNGVDGVIRDQEGRPMLQVRLAAPPVEGAANEALVTFLAAALGVRKSDVELVSGATSRVKALRIAGDGDALAARLEAWIGRDASRRTPAADAPTA